MPSAPTGLDRALWAALGAAAFCVLWLARALEPDPSGMGTHEQLGLPPCGFYYLLGLPCPTCGLTTSFAHMARLQITSAFASHWLGPALFALTALLVPLCVWGVIVRKPFAAAIHRLRPARVAAIIAAAVVASWLVRLLAMQLA